MSNQQDDVREFHVKFGVPAPDKIQVDLKNYPSRLRLKLILEEVQELIDASGYDVRDVKDEGPFDTQLVRLDELYIAEPEREPLQADMIDALVDLLYVTYGAAVAMGVDLDPFWDEVHRANMDKTGGGKRADGKIAKPKGWVGPDIQGILTCLTEGV